MKWWMADEYARGPIMVYPRLDVGRLERLPAGPEDEDRTAVRIFARKTWKPSR